MRYAALTHPTRTTKTQIKTLKLDESEEKAELAKEYIVKAASDYQLDDYMWYLACVHCLLQGWS